MGDPGGSRIGDGGKLRKWSGIGGWTLVAVCAAAIGAASKLLLDAIELLVLKLKLEFRLVELGSGTGSCPLRKSLMIGTTEGLLKVGSAGSGLLGCLGSTVGFWG